MVTKSVLALAGVLTITSSCFAELVVPNGINFPWIRSSNVGSAYAEWDIFTSPTGPNDPDVGEFVGGTLPPDAPAWDVYDSSGTAFITSGGNIYSFAAPILVTIVTPSLGLGENFTTTVVLQVRTQGSEIDNNTVTLDGAAPVEHVELLRETLGGSFGGYLIEALYRFEVQGNPSSHAIKFDAAATSLSLDRVAVDIYAAPSAPACAGDTNNDRSVNGADLSVLLSQFGTAVNAGSGADFNSDGVVNGSDLSVLLANFGKSC